MRSNLLNNKDGVVKFTDLNLLDDKDGAVKFTDLNLLDNKDDAVKFTDLNLSDDIVNINDTYFHCKDKLYNECADKFYKSLNCIKLDLIRPIIDNFSQVSSRMLGWFVDKYSKMKKINYKNSGIVFYKYISCELQTKIRRKKNNNYLRKNPKKFYYYYNKNNNGILITNKFKRRRVK
jgi:hypothetical protein